MSDDTISVIVVIDESFPLVSLAFVTEPLRLANRESARPVFSWRVVSPTGERPRSSSGLGLDIDGGLDDEAADAVILLASYFPDRMVSKQLIGWLRKRAASGALMGCVETGALIFAEAGLLSRRPAATHHEAIVGFREAYGEAYFSDQLYDLDQNRCSSAGGVATFDMTLAVIERFASRRLARRVAEILNYQPLETDKPLGTFGRDGSLPRLNRVLAQSVEIMLANLERPIAIGEIGRLVGLSPWRLRRLYQKHLGRSPQDYYVELRLDRARNLLRNSHERVGTVAYMCGFPALESMSRAYKARYGVSPSQDRGLYLGAGKRVQV